MIVNPVTRLRGAIRVPGDKSIAHRSLILGSIARGEQLIRSLPRSADIASTRSCLRTLGTGFRLVAEGVRVEPRAFRAVARLDAGNSGTTARLLAGLAAAHAGRVTLDGDHSLRRRPMRRVADPLSHMGATVTTTKNGTLPMAIDGGGLQPIRYEMPVASAQVKSAVLLAGLFASGTTTVVEPSPTRDHTERMLKAMGAPVRVEPGGIVSIDGGGPLEAIDVTIPGDISSAAFFVVAAACLRGSELEVRNVGTNPTRTGALRALGDMGAVIEQSAETESGGERTADLVVRSAPLHGIRIAGEQVATMIDELPVLAVAATQADGETIVSGATELRYKESDRIDAIVTNLRRMGADIEAHADGFVVRGPTRLRGARVDAFGDHRIAMAMAVAGLMTDGPTEITTSSVVSVSYPAFFEDLRGLTD